ncbi:MAG: hypothetical protein JRG91_19920 [Deltaproteobacteria bacterium]|nr:hypothetical protein [Deltaproteobacteria bacterium]
MATRTLRTLVIAIALVPWLVDCSDDKNPMPDGTSDVVTDTTPDTPLDVPAEVPTDTTTDPGVQWRTCARSCTTSDGCCLSVGQPCGSYPNKWACDAVCMTAGCDGDAECVTWATTIGLTGASGYKCSSAHLYWTAGYCVPGCTTAADCCPSGDDCSAYPKRRLCDAGACRVDACLDDAECRTWAGGLSLPGADTYACLTFEYSDTATCARPCTSTSDCCPSGSCGTFPAHVECLAGHCLATCTEDLECRDWAVSNGYPGAVDYVCHAF